MFEDRGLAAAAASGPPTLEAAKAIASIPTMRMEPTMAFALSHEYKYLPVECGPAT
jgi:hypothetical protein